MFDGMAEWMSLPLLHYEHLDVEAGRHGLSHASVYPYRPYACLDGEIVISVQSGAEWKQFCSGVLGQPDLSGDVRFASNPARVTNRDALDTIIGSVFAKRTCAEMIARLEESRTAWGRVSTLDILASHPALRRVSVRLPTGEAFDAPRPAGRAVPAFQTIPALGADTDRIRDEFAELRDG
jgi:crotonobetainyl-CoA:carnitine CoA-transferase CaiB-like acyl-CoA transferase